MAATQAAWLEVISGGKVVDNVNKSQPFHINVYVPYGKNDEVPLTIDVTVSTSHGTKSVTLKYDTFDPDLGMVRFVSNDLTLGAGGAGGGSFSIFGKLEWSTGDLGKIDVDNGHAVTFGFDDGKSKDEVDLTAYDTVRKQIFGVSQAYLAGLDGFVRSLLQQLKTAPDTAANRYLKEWAQGRLVALEQYHKIINNPEFTDVERAVYASEYANALHGSGVVDIGRDTSFAERIRMRIREGYEGAYHQFLKDFAVGVYQFTLSQLPFVQAAWSSFTGTDIFGNKLDGWEQALAILDLASQAALLGASMKFNLDHTVGKTTAKIQREYPTRPPGGVDITKAPGGTLVRTIEDYGMLGPQAKKFNVVLDKWSAEWGHAVEAEIRPTNRASVGHLAEGLDGKPEPIKAKSINEVDVKAGWGTELAEGTIGYYKPEQISARVGVAPDDIAKRVPDPANPGEYKWQTGKRPAAVPEDVWDRAVQRVKEYWDEKPMMDEILKRGLATVGEDGQVINQGISKYALDEHHNLVERPDGVAKGIGKGIAGDPDPYRWTDGKGNALPLWKQKVLEFELEGAGVKHGAITAWDPHEAKNIAIKDKILGAHTGKVDPATGQVVPATNKVENLVIFRGRFKPRVTGYGGVENPNVPLAKFGPVGKAAPGGPVLPGQPLPPASAGAGGAAPSKTAPDGTIPVAWAVDTTTGAVWPLDPDTLRPLEVAVVDPPKDIDVDKDDLLGAVLQAWAAANPATATDTDDRPGFGKPPDPPAPPPSPTPGAGSGAGAGGPVPVPPPAEGPWSKLVLAGIAAAVALGGLLIGWALGKDNGRSTGSGGGAIPTVTVSVPPVPTTVVAPTTVANTTKPPETSAAPATTVPAPPFDLGPAPVDAVGQFSGSGCGFAPTFTDTFRFSTNNGTLTIEQLSNGATVTGPINPDGTFRVEGFGRVYEGRVDGTTVEAAHTYTTPDGCVANYTVVFTLDSGQVVPAPEPTVVETTVVETTVVETTVAPTTAPSATDAVPTSVAGVVDGGGTDGKGIDTVLVILGALLAVAGITALIFGRKPPCSCSDELKAYDEATKKYEGLLRRQRELGLELAAKAAAADLHQKALDHWKGQQGPFQKYVDDLSKTLDELKKVKASLESMKGPLVPAGSVSAHEHPGWIKINDHLWAKDEKAAAGVRVAASLYEEAVWNGMVGQAIFKQIAIVDWQLNFVNGQLRDAVGKLQQINKEIASHTADLTRIRAEMDQIKAALKTIEADIKAANDAQTKAFEALEACKRACPEWAKLHMDAQALAGPHG